MLHWSLCLSLAFQASNPSKFRHIPLSCLLLYPLVPLLPLIHPARGSGRRYKHNKLHKSALGQAQPTVLLVEKIPLNIENLLLFRQTFIRVRTVEDSHKWNFVKGHTTGSSRNRRLWFWFSCPKWADSMNGLLSFCCFGGRTLWKMTKLDFSFFLFIVCCYVFGLLVLYDLFCDIQWSVMCSCNRYSVYEQCVHWPHLYAPIQFNGAHIFFCQMWG